MSQVDDLRDVLRYVVKRKTIPRHEIVCRGITDGTFFPRKAASILEGMSDLGLDAFAQWPNRSHWHDLNKVLEFVAQFSICEGSGPSEDYRDCGCIPCKAKRVLDAVGSYPTETYLEWHAVHGNTSVLEGKNA